MTDEVKPEPEIRERLWENVALHFERAVRVVVESRDNQTKKREALSGLVKLAYQAGLDRGYDMGHKVFGDGE